MNYSPEKIQEIVKQTKNESSNIPTFANPIDALRYQLQLRLMKRNSINVKNSGIIVEKINNE